MNDQRGKIERIILEDYSDDLTEHEARQIADALLAAGLRGTRADPPKERRGAEPIKYPATTECEHGHPRIYCTVKGCGDRRRVTRRSK